MPAAVKITVKDSDIGNLDNKSTIRVTAGAERQHKPNKYYSYGNNKKLSAFLPASYI